MTKPVLTDEKKAAGFTLLDGVPVQPKPDYTPYTLDMNPDGVEIQSVKYGNLSILSPQVVIDFGGGIRGESAPDHKRIFSTNGIVVLLRGPGMEEGFSFPPVLVPLYPNDDEKPSYRKWCPRFCTDDLNIFKAYQMLLLMFRGARETELLGHSFTWPELEELHQSFLETFQGLEKMGITLDPDEWQNKNLRYYGGKERKKYPWLKIKMPE